MNGTRSRRRGFARIVIRFSGGLRLRRGIMRRFPNSIIGTLAMFTSAACGGSDDSYGSGPTGGTTGSTSNSITVGNNRFDPATTTVAPATTVTWTWAQGSADHNVAFDDGTKSPTQATGTYVRTFATAGTYRYQCTIHAGM